MIDYIWDTPREWPHAKRTIEEYHANHIKWLKEKGHNAEHREQMYEKAKHRVPNPQFPYSVLGEAYHGTFDDIEDIAWKTLGPAHGECSKEWQETKDGYCHYHCPDIDIDDTLHERWWNAWDTGFRKRPWQWILKRLRLKPRNYWRSKYATFEEFFDHVYEGPENFEHSHIGVWRTQYLIKTGYDYGFQRFEFRRKQDLDDFLIKTTLGPQYQLKEK